jgi:hypothetical protein
VYEMYILLVLLGINNFDISELKPYVFLTADVSRNHIRTGYFLC